MVTEVVLNLNKAQTVMATRVLYEYQAMNENTELRLVLSHEDLSGFFASGLNGMLNDEQENSEAIMLYSHEAASMNPYKYFRERLKSPPFEDALNNTPFINFGIDTVGLYLNRLKDINPPVLMFMQPPLHFTDRQNDFTSERFWIDLSMEFVQHGLTSHYCNSAPELYDFCSSGDFFKTCNHLCMACCFIGTDGWVSNVAIGMGIPCIIFHNQSNPLGHVYTGLENVRYCTESTLSYSEIVDMAMNLCEAKHYASRNKSYWNRSRY